MDDIHSTHYLILDSDGALHIVEAEGEWVGEGGIKDSGYHIFCK